MAQAPALRVGVGLITCLFNYELISKFLQPFLYIGGERNLSTRCPGGENGGIKRVDGVEG